MNKASIVVLAMLLVALAIFGFWSNPELKAPENRSLISCFAHRGDEVLQVTRQYQYTSHGARLLAARLTLSPDRRSIGPGSTPTPRPRTPRRAFS